jgi:hypothetical protein
MVGMGKGEEIVRLITEIRDSLRDYFEWRRELSGRPGWGDCGYSYCWPSVNPLQYVVIFEITS